MSADLSIEPTLDFTEGLDRLNELARKANAAALPVLNDTQSDIRWKSFKFYVKDVGEAGTFEGYASVWGILDSDEEVVDKGSCARSIKNNPNFVLLWQHETRQPIGFAVNVIEDEHGLKLFGKLSLECESGRHAYAMLKLAKQVGGTARMGLSIGFRSIEKKWIEDPKSKKTYLHFTQIALMETSIVTFAANSDAYVTAVKSRQEAERLKKEATEQVAGSDSMDLDFDSALREQQRQREMRKHRSDIEDALYSTLSNIHGSDLDTDGKKAAVSDCYMKHAKAMTDWHNDYHFGDGAAKALSVQQVRKNAALDIVGVPVSGEPGITNITANIKTLSADELTEFVKANGGPGKIALMLQKAIDTHADALDKHKAIVKELVGDTSTDQTEMGSMAEKEALAAKEKADADAAALAAATQEKEDREKTEAAKAEAERQKSQTQDQAGDSGSHSLVDDLVNTTKSVLELLNVRNNHEGKS